MKTTSAFLAIAAAVIGFAYITPEASAKPPSKGAPGVHAFHKKDNTKKVAPTREKKVCKRTAKVSNRERTPYHERKRGAPPFRTRR